MITRSQNLPNQKHLDVKGMENLETDSLSDMETVSVALNDIDFNIFKTTKNLQQPKFMGNLANNTVTSGSLSNMDTVKEVNANRNPEDSIHLSHILPSFTNSKDLLKLGHVEELEEKIHKNHVSYWQLLLYFIVYEGWICLNAAIIYSAELGSCSVDYSLALYYFNEVALGIGYGLCDLPGQYTSYIIIASIITCVLGGMVILEAVGHLVEVEIKYGPRAALIAHGCTIAVFTMLYFTFVFIDMFYYKRDFYDSSYYVFSTAYASGEKGPYGFHRGPNMTDSMGTPLDRLLNVLCVQMMSLGFSYCAGVVAHMIWSRALKQKVLLHMEHKKEILAIKDLVNTDEAGSQTLLDISAMDALRDKVTQSVLSTKNVLFLP